VPVGYHLGHEGCSLQLKVRRMPIRFLILFLVSLSIAACSGGGFGGTAGGTVAAPSVSLTVPSQAYQDRVFSVDFSSSTLPITSVIIQDGPSWLSFNSATKKLEGTPLAGETFSNIKFLITFSDGTTSLQGPYSLTVKYDPLKTYQWNLKNTGQNGFSTSSGTPGMDINLDPSHSSGVLGSSSVILAVSDGRIDLSHEDLSANSDLTISKNYTLSSPYVGNPTSATDSAHGTIVASIMAAVGWNNIGIRGVCPSCKIIGYNFIESDQTVSKQINQAASSSVYVYNYSYGSGTCAFTPYDTSYISQVRSTALNGRSGKGSVFVTSAGNDFGGNNGGVCNFTYLGNSNLDQAKSYPYFMTVGAIDAQGNAASYSTPGSNSWVVAPGGEGGQTKPSVVGADLEGCSSGNSKTSATQNQFESNANGLNSSCKYTSTAMGTSFAAPTVAGVAGLMMSANSNLTWRDVKHILALTSKQIQPSAGNTVHPLGYNLTGHTYQQGWVTNGAGYKFHNWFGFGLIDAGAAVSMAKTYSSSLGTLVTTEDPKSLSSLYSKTGLALAIPDNSATGISDSIYLRHNLKAEAVQISLSINHTASSDLGVELTSPQGTKSILMNINSGITSTNLSNVTLLSNAFYGETSLGNWTLKVIDGAAADSGIVTAWSIKVWGSKVTGLPDITSPSPASNLTGPNYFMSDSVSPKFSWTASPSGDVLRYEYCVGTSSTDCSLYSWTGYSNALIGQATGMNLAIGNTYFFNVRTIDTSENISSSISRSWINDDGGSWTLTSMTNAPTAKTSAVAVWTGTQVLITGGYNGSLVYETHKYDPSLNTWTSATVPSTFFSNNAVAWTGTEMLLWSADSPSYLKIFNPTSNAWSAASNAGSNYVDTTMLWTGTSALVWGGGSYSNVGLQYNKAGNSWTAITGVNAPSGRNSHSSVWTGTEMIIWGGSTASSVYTNTGAKYNPTNSSWTTMSTVNAPSSRQWAASVWTGTEMIVWGGYGGEVDGGKYNPTSNTWTPITSFGAPIGCGEYARNIPAVWTGTKLIVAGCNSGYGGIYDSSTDTWQLIKPPSNVRPGFGHSLLWLGDRLLLWGGFGSTYQNTGATYVP